MLQYCLRAQGVFVANILDRRSTRLFLLRKGPQWQWITVFAALFLVAIIFRLHDSPGEADTLRNLASLENIQDQIYQSLSVQDPPQVPETLQTHIEALFSEVQNHPENKDVLLRQLKHVLQQNFKGQEDCWSCPGTEYFDRFDEISGSHDSRKPLGLQEWMGLGDEAFANQQMDEARGFYTEALQIADERVFQADEAVDEAALQRIRDRCVQLNCR
jgi:hypothetical protein